MFNSFLSCNPAFFKAKQTESPVCIALKGWGYKITNRLSF